jgi:ankyrin repeat protein
VWSWLCPTMDLLASVPFVLWAQEDKDRALFRACAAAKLSSVVELLDAGADVHAKDETGAPPLFWAVCSSQPFSAPTPGVTAPAALAVVSELLSRNASVDARDKRLATALHMACAWQGKTSVAVVAMLLEAKAQVMLKSGTPHSAQCVFQVNATTDLNRTPLQWLADRSDVEAAVIGSHPAVHCFCLTCACVHVGGWLCLLHSLCFHWFLSALSG